MKELRSLRARLGWCTRKFNAWILYRATGIRYYGMTRKDYDKAIKERFQLIKKIKRLAK